MWFLQPLKNPQVPALLLKLYIGENHSITVIGYSLGAALSALVANELGMSCLAWW